MLLNENISEEEFQNPQFQEIIKINSAFFKNGKYDNYLENLSSLRDLSVEQLKLEDWDV